MNWNLRYARGMDEESLNRLIPTTSRPIDLDNNNKASFQFHTLDRPAGNLKGFYTVTDSRGGGAHLEDFDRHSRNNSSEWEYSANEQLKKHFEEQPIDLPNKVDLHHPDNHQHILHRVKSWIATQV